MMLEYEKTIQDRHGNDHVLELGDLIMYDRLSGIDVCRVIGISRDREDTRKILVTVFLNYTKEIVISVDSFRMRRARIIAVERPTKEFDNGTTDT